jgi:hypothetical protein
LLPPDIAEGPFTEAGTTGSSETVRDFVPLIQFPERALTPITPVLGKFAPNAMLMDVVFTGPDKVAPLETVHTKDVTPTTAGTEYVFVLRQTLVIGPEMVAGAAGVRVTETGAERSPVLQKLLA